MCDLCPKTSSYHPIVLMSSYFSLSLITLYPYKLPRSSSNTFQIQVFELPFVSHLENSRELFHIPHACAQRHPIKEPFPLLKAQFQDATPTLQSIALIFFKAIFTLRCMFIIDNIVLPLRMKAM